MSRRRFHRCAGRAAERFAADARGSSTVEFAFIAPVFLTFMMVCIVVFDAARAVRQVGLAAQTVSDLATRVDEMDDARRDAMFATAASILGKYAGSSPFNVVISSIVNDLGDGDDEIRVVWSEAKVAGQELEDEDLDDLALPTIPEGESVIVVQFDLDYRLAFVVEGFSPDLKFEEVAIRRPRFVSEVCYRISSDEDLCSAD